MNKEDLKYTKTHEWIKIDGNTAIVGVSDFAQKEMGDIVFVDLPKVRAKLEKEKQACVVESVKSAFDIYAPVSGEVTEVNSELSNDPAKINQEPYGSGWIFKMKVINPSEANDLMNYLQYEEFLKTQSH